MNLATHFQGLSDPSRLRIINLLLHGELCGCDMQHLLEIPQPYVSRHMIYLKRVGLVVDRRVGFRVFYRLVEGKTVGQLFDFLRSAFRDEEVFVQDAGRLRQALIAGKLPSHVARRQPGRRGGRGKVASATGQRSGIQ